MNQVRNTIETLNTTHFKMTILYHSFKLIQTEEEENTCFGMHVRVGTLFCFDGIKTIGIDDSSACTQQ